MAAAAYWWLLRPRLLATGLAADARRRPAACAVATVAAARRLAGRPWPVVSAATLEKVCLVGLISVIYAEVLPGLDATPTGVFVGLAVLVLVNAVVSLALARGGRGTNRALVAFGLRVVLNLALVVVARVAARRQPGTWTSAPRCSSSPCSA